jgi:hypothetical protein
MDASGRLFQREGDGATTLLASVARDRLPFVFCLQIVIFVLLDFLFLIV